MFSIPVMRALSAYNIAYAALPATNAYMSFMPTADAAKQKQFTLHIPLGLIKPGAQTVFAAGDGLSTNFVAVQLSPTGQLDFVLMSGGVYVGRRTTTRTLQDYSGFYFVTLVMDTPNATALDRMRVYFDLTRETDFATTTNPAQNLATSVFAANVHNFLKLDYAANYGDVYLGGNTCLIGQVLEPSNFLDLDLGTGNVKAKDLTPLSPEYLFMFENGANMGETRGYYSANLRTVGSAIGNMTAYGGLAAGYDGVTSQANTSCAALVAADTYIGRSWGASKTITRFRVYSPNNEGFNASGADVEFRFYGSNTLPTHPIDGVLLLTSGAQTYSVPTSVYDSDTDGTLITTTGYAYHWVTMHTLGIVSTQYIAELEMFEAGTFGINQATVSGALNQVTSTPTNVYPTIDPNILIGTGTVSNGNRSYTRGATTTHDSVGCSMRIPSTGKYGWRVNPAASANAEDIGIAEISTLTPQLPGTGGEIGHRVGDFDCAYRSDANKWTGNTGTAYGATWNNTNYMHVGCDADAGTVEFFKDGVSQGVAFTGVDFTKVFVPALSQAETSVSTFDFTDAPAGYSTLCTNNLPAQTGNINDHFSTVLYTGDGGANNAIPGAGFQPDFVWLKGRSNAVAHYLFDAARALGHSLSSDTTGSEQDLSAEFISFGSDGFAVTNAAHALNQSPYTYTAWCASLPNTKTSGWAGSPDITPSKEIYNATLGMSVVTYTGNGAAATIPHSLGAVPKFVMIKRTNNTGSWMVYHASAGQGYLTLETANAYTNLATYWTSEPTSTLINTLTSNAEVNGLNDTYVAYIFAETKFCKIGSYVGNGSADGSMVNAGISPVWMLHKNATTGGGLGWMLFDNKRKPYNHQSDTELSPNLSAAEPSSGGGGEYDFTSSGAKQRTTRATYNSASNTYIYLMIGQPNGPVENTAR